MEILFKGLRSSSGLRFQTGQIVPYNKAPSGDKSEGKKAIRSAVRIETLFKGFVDDILNDDI